MYSAKLQTPHPRFNDASSVPLLDALQASTIRTDINALHNTTDQANYDITRVSNATAIANLVHKTLLFPYIIEGLRNDFRAYDLPFPLTLETLEEKQAANCFGHTVVASECMEQAGIDHQVAYANDHAFVVLPTGSTTDRSSWFIDPTAPWLSRDLTPVIRSKDLMRAESEISQYGRGAVFLRMHLFAGRSNNQTETIQSLAADYTWPVRSDALRFTQKDQRGYDYARFLRINTKLIMSLFPPASGRNVLINNIGFERAMADHQWRVAAGHITAMAGLYPELDARSQHREVKKLVANLAIAGQAELAKSVIEDYFASFAISNDPRLAKHEADCWLKIHQPKKALRRFNKAQADSKVPDYLSSKLKKVGDRVEAGLQK